MDKYYAAKSNKSKNQGREPQTTLGSFVCKKKKLKSYAKTY